MHRDSEFADSCEGSSSSKVSSSLQESQQGQPAWQQGCYQKYSCGSCKVPGCPYLHDLSPTEVQRFLDWKQEQQQHVLFHSQSNSRSHSTRTAQSNSNSGASNSRESSANESAESLVKEARSSPMGPERQQLYRRLRKHFNQTSDRELAATLPKDDLGWPTSIGSLLHQSGTCKACRNIVAMRHCKDGMRCVFCHIPHDSTEMVSSALVDSTAADARRGGFRPAKSQRDKYKRQVERVEQVILEDPFGWTPDMLELQNMFPGRPDLQNKFLMRVTAIAEKARADNRGKETRPSASSSSAAASSAPRAAATAKSGKSSGQKGKRLVSL